MVSSLEVVLHLAELAHDADRVGLARCLLDFWVLNSHEHVVFLFIANGELAGRHLVDVGKRLQLLDRVRLGDGNGELDVGLGVLMPGIDNSLVREGSEALVESLVHLVSCSLEELATSADEEGVTSKDGLASAILQEVADAILGVAGSVDVGHLDIAQLRDFVVLRSLCYSLAILATDDSQVGGAELSKKLLVSSSMVPMVVGIDNGSQVDPARADRLLEHWNHLGRVGWVNDHSILRLVIYDEVRVVITTSHPQWNSLNMHGADMLKGPCNLSQRKFS